MVPTFYPAIYFGGPIYSLLGLCNALARRPGIRFRVLTTDSSGPSRNDRLAIKEFPVLSNDGYEIYYCRKWCGKEFSASLLIKLFPMIRWADAVHLTSAYSFSTLPTLLFCRLLRKPVVWSPRGQLQRWEGSTRPLFKRFWEIICNRLLNPRLSVLHVTSTNEADESHRRIARVRVEIVENGVEIPTETPDRLWTPVGTLRLLFIGRLDPKKGIENLLRALKQFDEKVSLIVCGTGDPDYASSLRMLAAELGLSARVKFAGQVEGEAKSRAFWNADTCVVPSHTENFAMVVAEALAYGVPVIASRGTPWKELVERQCGLWVENDPSSLANAVTEMRGRNLGQMGKNGRWWMEQSFSWASVAGRMHAVYSNLVSGAGK